MKYILISPESGITPQNLHTCFSQGFMLCTDVKGVKELNYDPAKGDIIALDPMAGITFEDIKNLKGNIVFVNSLSSIKVI